MRQELDSFGTRGLCALHAELMMAASSSTAVVVLLFSSSIDVVARGSHPALQAPDAVPPQVPLQPARPLWCTRTRKEQAQRHHAPHRRASSAYLRQTEDVARTLSLAVSNIYESRSLAVREEG